jgi:hypothetical protein
MFYGLCLHVLTASNQKIAEPRPPKKRPKKAKKSIVTRFRA